MLRTRLAGAFAAAIGIAASLAPGTASVQSNPQYIAFPGVSKGALYRPDSGPAPHVGIIAMHRTANYLNHPSCRELSRRGFLMLCMNTRYENNESQVDFEKLPLDVKAGVEFLRRQAGVIKVLLFAHSGGGPLMSVARGNQRFRSGTKMFTLRSFLSANAIRAGNAVDDIDYCSTNNSTICAVQTITVPVMFAAMGAHYFIRDNELQFDMARSKDKDFVVIEGANHGFTPCVPCETAPGQYSNTMKNLFDYVANWINAQF
jgi:hypothetical protein